MNELQSNAPATPVSGDGNRQAALHPFDLLLLYIASLSCVSIVLLLFSLFKSVYALLFGTAAFLVALKASDAKIEIRDRRLGWGLLLILLLALFFRQDTNLWTQGGQDQGLYVSLSSHLETQGGMRGVDKLRDKLDANQKVAYDKHNSFLLDGIQFRHLGVLVADKESSLFLFPWYPLHAVWMAIFAKFLGPENRVYSVVFFSIISIIALYLLAVQISGGNRIPAYLLAIFLAVSPLHVFFSKFPMTEMVFLAFTCSSILYLHRYYQCAQDGSPYPFYLFLSAALMACASYTRMTIFLYVPLFGLLSLLTVIFIKDMKVKRHLLLYFASFLLIMGISVVFYHSYVPWLLGPLGRPSTWGALSLFVVFLFGINRLAGAGRLQGFISWLSSYRHVFLVLVVAGVLAAAVYHVREISVSRDLHGLRLLGSLPLVWYGLHLSPVGLIVFILSAYHFWRKGSQMQMLLLFFLATSLCFYLLRLSYIITGVPYQYYHARFLLPELVPFSLLLSTLYMADLWKQNRLLVYSGVALIVAFFTFFSMYLVVNKEEPDRNFLAALSSQVRPTDLLAIPAADKSASSPHLTAPLVYCNNLNVQVFKDIPTLYDDEYRNIWRDFDDIYLLLSDPVQESQAMRFVTKLRYTLRFIRTAYPDGRLTFGNFRFFFKALLPTAPSVEQKTYYLYRLLNAPVVSERPADIGDMRTITAKKLFLADVKQNVTNLWDDGWTNGNVFIKNLRIRVDRTADRYVILQISAFTPLGDSFDKCRVDVFANATRLKFDHQKGNRLYFRLDKAITVINDMNIKSCTFVPKEMGINNDSRTLGVGIRSVALGEE